MIEQLKLKNFMAFENLEVAFSPKINIIIGENGSGKTQLLKSIYALHGSMPKITAGKHSLDDNAFTSLLTIQLIKLFMPLSGKLGKMHHAAADDRAQLQYIFSGGKQATIEFHNNSQKVAFKLYESGNDLDDTSVFIPSKEVLSFLRGFVSLYDKYEISFDRTYQDIALLLDLPPLRDDNMQEKAKWAMTEIEQLCGGKFIFHGGGNVTFKTRKDVEYSANAAAEGFRKLGALSRLIENGSIRPGVSGPLLWDEPEANLNPKLVQLLVQILLELSRNGQQIILATHDYVLLKWFDLLGDEGKGDHIRYHNLYHDPERNNEISIYSSNEYTDINNASIFNAFSDLYNTDIKRTIG